MKETINQVEALFNSGISKEDLTKIAEIAPAIIGITKEQLTTICEIIDLRNKANQLIEKLEQKEISKSPVEENIITPENASINEIHATDIKQEPTIKEFNDENSYINLNNGLIPETPVEEFPDFISTGPKL